MWIFGFLFPGIFQAKKHIPTLVRQSILITRGHSGVAAYGAKNDCVQNLGNNGEWIVTVYVIQNGQGN